MSRASAACAVTISWRPSCAPRAASPPPLAATSADDGDRRGDDGDDGDDSPSARPGGARAAAAARAAARQGRRRRPRTPTTPTTTGRRRRLRRRRPRRLRPRGGQPASSTCCRTGRGFLRTGEGDDVYVSPAQIRRCELRAGDEVAGPSRARSAQRAPSLAGARRDRQRPRRRAARGAAAVRRPHRRPSHRAADRARALDPVAFGKGSRVAVAGGPGAGATGSCASWWPLVADKHSDVSYPSCWWARARRRSPNGSARVRRRGDRRLVRPLGRGAGAGGRARRGARQAGGRARRRRPRGHRLAGVPARGCRAPDLFGAARKLEEGGSLTVVAATGMAWEPQRQASTRVALDRRPRTARRRFRPRARARCAPTSSSRPGLRCPHGGQGARPDRPRTRSCSRPRRSRSSPCSTTQSRVERVDEELRRGFATLAQVGKAVSIFGSARTLTETPSTRPPATWRGGWGRTGSP